MGATEVDAGYECFGNRVTFTVESSLGLACPPAVLFS